MLDADPDQSLARTSAGTSYPENGCLAWQQRNIHQGTPQGRQIYQPTLPTSMPEAYP